MYKRHNNDNYLNQGLNIDHNETPKNKYMTFQQIDKKGSR